MKKIIAILLLSLLLSVAASAQPLHSDLSGGRPSLTEGSNTISVDADATWDGAFWNYSYTIDTTNALYDISGFSIADTGGLAYSDTWNDKGFTNPVWTSTSDSIYWMNNTVPCGGIFKFGYKSEFAPGIEGCTLFGGTRMAKGQTLGMVPEPMSMSTLGAMMLGGFGAAFRRRHSK